MDWFAPRATGIHDRAASRKLDLMLVLVVLLHGPIDIGLTLAFIGLESNQVVIRLGVPAWVAIKAVAMLSSIWVWYDAGKDPLYHEWAKFFLGTWFGIGLFGIVPNIAVVVESFL